MGKFYEDTFIFKVLFVGDSTVGKSSLMMKYTEDTFKYDLTSTIGVDFQSKSFEYNETKMKMQIWDTAGQERFRSITSAYYREADCGIICFDICNRQSFLDLAEWLKNVKERCEPGTLFYLVGNKIDLNKERVVETEEGEQFASKNNLYYCEISSKKFSSEQIHDVLFSKIIEDLYNRDKDIIDAGPINQNNMSLDLIEKRINCCQLN